MVDQGLPIKDLDEPLKHWRQGDFALDVGGFLFAGIAEGDDPFDAEDITENIVGLVVISQTCDIVRCTSGRYYVAVCPLIKVTEQDLSAIRKGRRPYFTDIENTNKEVVADLRRVMSVHKNVLQTWEHQTGFSNDITRRRFGAALERKFGQFAFPDDFDEAIKQFRKRVWSRHAKPTSELGKIYRSLDQIRFAAEPNWTADKRKITVIAVLKEEDNREIDRATINKELNNILDKVLWPDGYAWSEQKFILATAKDLTAEDILLSQRGDFDFLCY